METLEYRTMDEKKAEYGPGPWHDEPDKVQWPDVETGLPCLIVRNQSGALCGYVGLPAEHPWATADSYWDLPVSVHGGLTYMDPCRKDSPEDAGICHIPGPGEPDDVVWVGFDTAHGEDYVPAYNSPEATYQWGGEYRDMAYVTAQVTGLARQVAEASA